MNKKGVIGQFITSFPSLILVFVIMVLFVGLSIFITGNSTNENLLDDFLNHYIVFDGNILTVNSVLQNFCDDNSIGEKLNPILRNEFIKNYGQGNIFVLSYLEKEGQPKIVSWAGLVDPYVNNGTITDYENFNKLVDFREDNNVKRICNRIDVYAKYGGVK